MYLGKINFKQTSLMLNPSPALMKEGSSTSSMYQPKLLRVCVMSKAQNGTDNAISFSGTGGLFYVN
jgi:hypothetical protein